MLTDINGEIDSNTIRVGNFNKPLQQWTDHSDKKIGKETQAICETLDHMNLILINKTFHLKEAEYIFFSCGTFSKTEYMLHHKASLSIFKKIETITNIFSKRNALRLEINCKGEKKKTAKGTNTWGPNNVLLSSQWITEEIKVVRKHT